MMLGLPKIVMIVAIGGGVAGVSLILGIVVYLLLRANRRTG